MSVTTETTPTMTEPLLDNEVNDMNDNSNSMESSSAVRKRTRATAEQLAVLEDTFAANVSPNSKLRKQLSERLQMSERSIQIWFQNRRAKVKHMQKRAQMQMQQASIRAQLYHYHQQQYMHHPHHPQPTYLAPGNPPIMPLPQHHHPHPVAIAQQQHQQQHQQQYNNNNQRIPLPTRSQSVDSSSLQYNNNHSMNPTPPASISSSSSSSTTSPPSSLDNIPSSSTTTTSNNTSYPLQENVDFPDYLNGGPLSPSASPHHDFQSVPLSHPLNTEESSSSVNDLNNSNASALPTLVSVPDAGPTAMLSTGSNDHLVSTPATTPPSMMDQPTVSPQDIWPASIYHTNLMRSQSVAAIPMATTNSEFSSTHLERSLSNPPVTTIDPSNLMMNNSNRLSTTPPVETTTTENNNNNNNENKSTNESSTKEIYDVYLNCTTLTIGTWHRLKLRASDLLCVFKDNAFEWHIEDAGCHFKMEISLSSVASIDFVEDNNGLADVHFDISESPLFYMETANNNNNDNNASSTTWVQCSDFTEGKQASRFFRHSLKGVSQHLKQDLMTLMDKCPDARRWVRFLDPISQHPTSVSLPQHPTQHPHPNFSSAATYPLTNFDPMLTGNQHPSHFSNPMSTMMSPNTSSPSTYFPHVPPSYWPSMYPQAPMMMGVSNYLV